MVTASILATDRSRPRGMACLLLCANRVLWALSAARPSIQIAGRRRPQRDMIDGWQMRIVFIFLLVRKYLLTVVLNIRVRIAGAVDELRVLCSSYRLTWPARLVGRCLKKIGRVPLERERIGPVQIVRQRDPTVPDTVRRYRLVWRVRRGGFQSVRDDKRRED